MPEETERQRREAADGRYFEIATGQVDALRGTTQVTGSLDLADALDLEDAVAAGAKAAGRPGEHRVVERPPRHGGRRDGPPGPHPRPHQHHRHRRRAVTMPRTGRRARRPGVVVRSCSTSTSPTPRCRVGRTWGAVRTPQAPVTTEQIRSWCATPDAVVTVKPVIDLNDHVRVDAYEVPDRLREAAVLTDLTCVFPWCTRKARRCDCDHCRPHGEGGETASHNIAPLCRRHHRLKTHGGWRYVVIERGSYLWTNRYGYQWLRDHHGTTDLTPKHGPDGPTTAPTTPAPVDDPDRPTPRPRRGQWHVQARIQRQRNRRPCLGSDPPPAGAASTASVPTQRWRRRPAASGRRHLAPRASRAFRGRRGTRARLPATP